MLSWMNRDDDAYSLVLGQSDSCEGESGDGEGEGEGHFEEGGCEKGGKDYKR